MHVRNVPLALGAVVHLLRILADQGVKVRVEPGVRPWFWPGDKNKKQSFPPSVLGESVPICHKWPPTKGYFVP
jgi:hypothetical protein